MQKAPFWLEKLPEIPELLYHNLAQAKSLQKQQTQLVNSLNKQQQCNNKSRFYTGAAITLTAISALAYLHTDQDFALLTAIPGIFAWLLAWRHTNQV